MGEKGRGLREAIKKASDDRRLYEAIEGEGNASKALADFDLSARELRAFLTHDFLAFRDEYGLSRDILELAGWCTGD